MSCPAHAPFPHACRFIHDWVYSGVFRDVYGEFMIQVNHEYLGFRGRWGLLLGGDTAVGQVRAALVAGLSGHPTCRQVLLDPRLRAHFQRGGGLRPHVPEPHCP